MAGRKLQAIRLSEAADLYYEYMRSCGLEKATIGTAKSTLNALLHVVGNKVVSNIDWQDITKYLNARSTGYGTVLPVLAPATIKLQMHRLRMFNEWAVRFHFIDSSADWMQGRKKIKLVPSRRNRVEAQDFPALLDAAENPRDRMVLALGIYTLMRGGEIRGLRISDLQLQDSLLQMVRYKTKERDELAVCAELRVELANYLMWYSTNVGRELDYDWYLCPTNERRKPGFDLTTRRFVPAGLDQLRLVPDKPLYPQASAWIVQRALNKIGWDVTVKEGGHTLRRSAARELFETLRSRGGFDDALLVVMSWLGHKQPQTTMIYLGLDKEADRRNKLYKDATMYPRITQEQAAAVTPLRVVDTGS